MKYNDILVSIIVPVYNVQDYLVRCVHSLCIQTHKNIEIILINDGATDNCPQICDEFASKDHRIVVHHQKNAGLAAARNAGICIAHGDWICFVDSDDFISEYYVEYMLTAVLENGALMGQCRYIKGIGEKLPPVSHDYKIKRHDLNHFFEYCYTTPGHSIFACWVNIYHRSLFDKIRFPLLEHTEDVPTVQECLNAASSKNLVTVDQIMYYWFQRSGSIMNRKSDLRFLAQSKAYELVINFWKDNIVIREVFQSIYFACLVDEYTKLRRDAPEMREEYEGLVEKIKFNLPAAIREPNGWIVFPSLKYNLFKYLNSKEVIMYGYGENGRKLLPWLRFFGVSVVEIWDNNAPPSAFIEEIPLRKMHGKIHKDVIILQTVEAAAANMSIKRMLLQNGYTDIFEWKLIEPECRYKILSLFLPFLLGEINYENV